MLPLYGKMPRNPNFFDLGRVAEVSVEARHNSLVSVVLLRSAYRSPTDWGCSSCWWSFLTAYGSQETLLSRQDPVPPQRVMHSLYSGRSV